MKYKMNNCNYDIKEFIRDNFFKEFNLYHWNDWLEKQNYDCLVIKPNLLISVEDEDGLIGIGSVKVVDDKECIFNTFYVKKQYRNKGIGNNIFNLCMNYIENSGYKKINLCVDPKFEVARRIYEKSGFVLDYYDQEKEELHYYKFL